MGFERFLHEQCGRLSRIVRTLGSGTINVDGSPLGIVEYIVFELADKDVRHQLSIVDRSDITFRLQLLHHVSTALRQLHLKEIAHQDLKPSNVLFFSSSGSKVADLGSASHFGSTGPFDHWAFAGDWRYAPPEFIYGYLDNDWKRRRFCGDLYALGSMALFCFSGVGSTPALMSRLDKQHKPTSFGGSWSGSFGDILPYLHHVFGPLVENAVSGIDDDVISAGIKETLQQLCEPDPRRRGIPVKAVDALSDISLERYISKFNNLAGHAEIRLRRRAAK
jgi:serine/threonine protein kinase